MLLDHLDLTGLKVFEADCGARLGVKVLAKMPVDFASLCLKLNCSKIVGAFEFMKFETFNIYELLIRNAAELRLRDAFEKIILAVLVGVSNKW